MELIVDKDFLHSFFTYNSSDKHKPLFDDFVRFLRKLQPGFTLVSNFSSLEELFGVAATNPLLEIIIEKTPKVVLEADFEHKFKQKEYYEHSGCLKLFLTDFKPEDCRQLEDSFGYSFICGANLSTKWKTFFSDRDDAVRYITTSLAFEEALRFDSWARLESYKHPVNAVLIVDKYILSDKSNQRIDQNLKPLLKSLLPKKKTELPVDVTIIAEQDKQSAYKEPGKFKTVYDDISLYLSRECPHLHVNLSIMKFDRDILYKLSNQGFDIHDRRIITNYFWIESGIGFNIINNRGRVKDSDSTISFKFNMLGPNYKGLQHFLKGYAAYAGIAKEVYGSNKNRLLTHLPN